MTTPIYRSASLRRIEAANAAAPLMQRAGATAAALAAELAIQRERPILVLAGPGNNGGDAFEAARLLRERFFATCVVFAGDPQRLPPDAAAAYRRFAEAGGTTAGEIPGDSRWSLIIDGLFGIGLARAPADDYAEWISTANALAVRDACPLLALDCPSGLDADSGCVFEPCIRASHTITFIGAKPGLLTADGPDHCGELRIADLDLPATPDLPVDGQLLRRADFANYLQRRPLNSHKGSFGNAGILGGAPTMVGAAFLAGRAALKLGAGRVYLGLLDAHPPACDLLQPELMLRRARTLLQADLTALACGPGLGNSIEANELLETAIATSLPLLLDADALNLVASEGNLQVALASREAPAILTPHPAEAARLLASTTAEIQADRLAAALEIAGHYHCHVALKGCGTVIVTVDGRWWINSTGNPGMASAGMGDVLSGLIVALLAQGWPVDVALLAGVHLHGAAADRLVADGVGPVGLTAGEVIDAARRLFNEWTAGTVNHPVS